MTHRKSCFVERGLLVAFDFLIVSIFFPHLRPVDGDSAREDIRVQLCVFYPAKMLGESLARQSLCLAFAALVLAAPPALHVLPFVDPNLSHNIESIVVSKGRIKRKNGLGKCESVTILETCGENPAS